MQVRDDVTRTADESEVSLNARSNRHSSVQRGRHQDDRLSGADRFELVVVAVLLTITRRRCNETQPRRPR